MLAFRGYPLVNMYSPGAKILLLVLVVWSLIWKGIALWKAVRNNSKPWFIVLLLVNTVGILEILYIYWLSKSKQTKAE